METHTEVAKVRGGCVFSNQFAVNNYEQVRRTLGSEKLFNFLPVTPDTYSQENRLLLLLIQNELRESRGLMHIHMIKNLCSLNLRI
jgi:hypothetical protein